MALDPTITVVPKTWRGVRFRSTLEADWACTLDHWQIEWTYEPETVQLPSGTWYQPDFYLPGISTWFEVKGAHNERLEKTQELADTTNVSEWWFPGQAVVIGRAPLARWANWEVLPGECMNMLAQCKKCWHRWFMDDYRSFECRHCGEYDGDGHLAEVVPSGDVPFVRVRDVE
jgi:hypothetical protein